MQVATRWEFGTAKCNYFSRSGHNNFKIRRSLSTRRILKKIIEPGRIGLL